MMQYFKVAPGKFIGYDDVTSRATIIFRDELLDQKRGLQARVSAADPNQPKTNAEWIAWAKANYPYTDHSLEQIELDKVSAIIEAIRAL